MSVWYHELDPNIIVFSCHKGSGDLLGLADGFHRGKRFNVLMTELDLKASGWIYIGELI